MRERERERKIEQSLCRFMPQDLHNLFMHLNAFDIQLSEMVKNYNFIFAISSPYYILYTQKKRQRIVERSSVGKNSETEGHMVENGKRNQIKEFNGYQKKREYLYASKLFLVHIWNGMDM